MVRFHLATQNANNLTPCCPLSVPSKLCSSHVVRREALAANDIPGRERGLGRDIATLRLFVMQETFDGRGVTAWLKRARRG